MKHNLDFEITVEDLQPLQTAAEDTSVEYRHSTWKTICQGFLETKSGMVCLIFLALIILAACCAPLSGYDPNAIDATARLAGISPKH